MKKALCCFVLLSALIASTIYGQVIYNNASTAAEGYQRGLSGVISAQGQKNLSDSQAAINLTDARSSQIDNQVKSVNAFWQKNSIYDQHLQQKFAQIEQKRSAYLAKNGLKSLTPEQFDRSTGSINWPKVLTQKQYDPYRKKLDELFRKRAYEGYLSGPEYKEATTAMSDWHAMMVKQKDEYPGPVLDQMLKFVLSVRRELDDNLS
jgi:oligoendopeptidase F